MVHVPDFGIDDTAQQVVGGFLIAGPFVVTEEVWRLAANMSELQAVLTMAVVGAIGFGALYSADRNRDIDRELMVSGIPLRFISLMLVSYGSVIILAYLFAAPETFGAGLGTTAKAATVGAIFSVIGAATADSIF